MTTSKLSKFALRWLAPAFGILLAAHGAENVPIDRTMRDFKTPQDFEWKSRPNSASQTVALFGDPAKPGLYIQTPETRPRRLEPAPLPLQ